MSVTSGRRLIDAPLLHLDRNCAITRAHRFLLAHKSGRSQDKECDTEKQQAGRREVLRTPSLIAAKVPEEEWVGGWVEVEGRLRLWIRLTRMKYCPPPPLPSSSPLINIARDCAAQDTSESRALLFPRALPPLLASLLRGRWGTFLGSGSSSSTPGINPLQLCPLPP